MTLTLQDGSQRSGQVLEVSGSKAVVQVRLSTQGPRGGGGARGALAPPFFAKIKKKFPKFFTKGLFTWAQLTGLAQLPGWMLPWGSCEELQPGFWDEKRLKILGMSSGAKFKKNFQPAYRDPTRSVSIKHGLQTGYKIQTRYKTRTTDWV